MTTKTLKQNSYSSLVSKIGFHCPLWGTGTDSGYSYAAVELIKAWQAKGIPVWAQDTDAPVIFNMGQPHFYERVEGKLNIGYTAWESTEITESWVQAMNRMDEIWAPSQFNIDCYAAAGVTVPLRVLPHGINENHWSPIRRSTDGTFKFLHIGGDAPRKGAVMVYDAFKEVFGDDPNFQLTLKGRKLQFKPKGENVVHHSELIPVEELRQMYYDHHAMIYPTNGEGFGLIPFQAAATGMPVACTDWGGCTEFGGYTYPIGVHYLTTPTYAPHIGHWAQPQYEDVVKWMESFTILRYAYAKQAFDWSHGLCEKFSWDRVSTLALEYMTESLNTKHA